MRVGLNGVASAERAGVRPPGTRATRRRLTVLAAAVVALAAVMLASLAVGSKPIDPGHVLGALFRFDGSDDEIIVRDLRVPRTLLGLLIGAGLGLAGTLMQALTRNPLADPGILGVNAGAAAAVALAISALGVTTLSGYVWFALAGAAVATVVVYLLGSVGRAGLTPVRLALGGTAVSAVLTGLTTGIVLLDQRAFDQFRFWRVGSLAAANADTVWLIGPFILVGVLLALPLAGSLNAVALGDDTARSLGARLGRVRAVSVLSITLLCGAATAAVGPIGFVGLTVPHLARALTGPDQRWLLPCSLVLSPILLLTADVVGRVVARPGELQVGIVTAVVGAPVFIALVRGRRVREL